MTHPSNAAGGTARDRLTEIAKAVLNDIHGYTPYHEQVSKAELLALLVEAAEDNVLPVNGGREVLVQCPNTLERDTVDGRLCIQRKVERPDLTWKWHCWRTVVAFRGGMAELADRDEWCVAAETAAAFGHTHL